MNTQHLSSFQYWLSSQILLIRTIFVILATFFVFRLTALVYFNDSDIEWMSLANDFWLGFRLDLKTALLLLFPGWILSFIQLYQNQSLNKIVIGFSRFWYTLTCFIVIYFAITNFFYYSAFNNFIDIFFFAFFERENFINVSKTLLSDYPVIPGILVMLIFAWFVWRKVVVYKLYNPINYQQLSAPLKVVIVVMFSLVYGYTARGAIDARPLTLGRAPVSSNVFYNKLMPNGFWAFYEAYKEQGNKYSFKPVDQVKVKAAIKNMTGKSVPSTPKLHDLKILTTQKAPDFKQPNVVFISMESMGAHAMSFHSATNNLLGRLEKHIKQDWFFNNFYATSMTTANTLDRILIGQPFNLSIASGLLQNTSYDTSVANVFKSAGYETWFVTTGRKNFTNMGNFLQRQGFDHIADEFTIKQTLPNAKSGRAWGIYDQYGFDYIHLLLKQSNKPMFVVFLTTTNHSPFEPPEDYQEKPLDMTEIESRSVINSRQKLHKIFRTYQYSNDALGGFMDKVRNNKVTKDNTIVAATGDHYLRHVFNYDQDISTLNNKYRVPLYLYLPKSYEPKASNKDTYLHRLGGHKDIFPTLFNRALSNTGYYSLGTDLFSEQYNSESQFAENVYFAISDKYAIEDTPQGDKNLKWQSNKLIPASFDDVKPLRVKRDNYRQLLNWLVLCQYKNKACPNFYDVEHK